MIKEITRQEQTYLQYLGYYKDSVDGLVGRNTRSAVESYCLDFDKINHFKGNQFSIAFFQLRSQSLGLYSGKIDGVIGPLTKKAFTRKEAPKVEPITTDVPRSDYDSLVDFYGEPGTNLVTISIPYTIYYIGKAVNRITCHQKVKDSLLNVLSSTNQSCIETYNYYLNPHE